MMKLQDLLKDLELGKVYTDKDRKPFQTNEEILKEVKKVPFDKVKVGTKLTYEMGVVYIVTKVYPGGFMMRMYKSGNNPGMFAPKARIEKDNYESQVKMGFIKKINEEKLNELGGFSTPGGQGLTGDDYTAPKRDDKGDAKSFLQKFSSNEAKAIVDGGLKNYVKDLRKVEGRIVKDWMKAAKSGQIDFFDIIRGLKTGDVKRAHPYEMDFFVELLTKNKIVDRFRSYFKGKKGKKGRTK